MNDDDRNHTLARRWVDANLDARLVTHVAVVSESTALLDRRLGTTATGVFLGRVLPTIAVFTGSELTYERALAAYRTGTERRRPSLVDCLAFETMRELHVHDAFAFDDHFERLGFRLVPGQDSPTS